MCVCAVTCSQHSHGQTGLRTMECYCETRRFDRKQAWKAAEELKHRQTHETLTSSNEYTPLSGMNEPITSTSYMHMTVGMPMLFFKLGRGNDEVSAAMAHYLMCASYPPDRRRDVDGKTTVATHTEHACRRDNGWQLPERSQIGRGSVRMQGTLTDWPLHPARCSHPDQRSTLAVG